MTALTDLKPGSTGSDVRWLQTRLTALGYELGAADGIFGPKTEAAVRSFQAVRGLDVDGIVGPKTRAALRQSPDYAGLNAISRLIQFNGRGKYVLGGGGVNPNSSTPFTWVGAQYGSDCVGALMWAFQSPRSRSDFPEYEGDINCDSAMMDAGLLSYGKGEKKFFEPVDPKDIVPGVIAVYPSIRARELPVEGQPNFWSEHGFTPNKRVRIGHIGLICGWEGLQDPFKLDETPWDGDLRKLVTIECRAAWPAIRMGRNVSFLGNTKYSRLGHTWENERWGCRFMRWVG